MGEDVRRVGAAMVADVFIKQWMSLRGLEVAAINTPDAHRTFTVVTERNGHLGPRMDVSYDLLEGWMRLPPGHEVHHVSFNEDKMCARVVIEGPEMPPCPEGAMPPRVNLIYERYLTPDGEDWRPIEVEVVE